MASPPFAAKFTIAALVAVVLDDGAVLAVEAGVEATTVVPAAVVRAVVKVEESVMFEPEELGDGVADGKLEVMFALVEVETTVTVDEGMEEVLVEVEVALAVYDGPVESLIVVVEPPVADELVPDPLMWNGAEYSVRVVFFSSTIKKPYVAKPPSVGVQVYFPSKLLTPDAMTGPL